MSRLTKEQAASVLEDRVTKIVKAMQVLVKDAPRIADVLDEEARLKTEAFLQSHFVSTMRELALAATFRPARTSFSLDAPIATTIKPPTIYIPQTSALGSVAPPPSVPQAMPATGVVPADRKPWRKPTGRLVGKQGLVYDEERHGSAGDEITEVPDKTGGIRDAGFIEAE
jgi:hypothetical protein